MNEKVQEPVQEVQNNVQKFKKVYNEILKEIIERRKSAGFSQQFMAEWLNVDRRKIIELEKGKVSLGLLINYAERLDVDVKLNYDKY
jgi:DNA-binding XRE family transcriptional regulator